MHKRSISRQSCTNLANQSFVSPNTTQVMLETLEPLETEGDVTVDSVLNKIQIYNELLDYFVVKVQDEKLEQMLML